MFAFRTIIIQFIQKVTTEPGKLLMINYTDMFPTKAIGRSTVIGRDRIARTNMEDTPGIVQSLVFFGWVKPVVHINGKRQLIILNGYPDSSDGPRIKGDIEQVHPAFFRPTGDDLLIHDRSVPFSVLLLCSA
jgi:hypothetical protein